MKLLLPAVLLLFFPSQSPAGQHDFQQQVRQFRQAHEQQIMDDFVRLLAIPNVASDQINIQRNADYIQQLLETRGLTVRQLRAGNAPPVVYGELLSPGADLTLVVYIHYDGQPVQAQNWASDPWQPTLRSGPVDQGGQPVPVVAPFNPDWRLYARSAGDDKAPVIALLYALDALAASGRSLSVNLKVFLEGEEEAGSPNLRAVLEQHKDLLAADLWLFCDGPVHQTRRWQLAYGVRGTLGFELQVFGPVRPLHSGHYGNWSPNPIAMLVDLLHSMRDALGQVHVEGFYDQVIPPGSAELQAIATAPAVDALLRDSLALNHSEGSPQRLEQRLLQPALNFRGIQAGGVGAESRNVIVPSARASVGIRMVPDQTIGYLQQAIEAHLKSMGYFLVHDEPDHETLRSHPRVARIDWENGSYPSLRTAMDHPVAARVADILDRLSGNTLVRQPTMGGSLPLYHFNHVLDVPVLILPIANHDNNQHGHDENIRLQNLWDGIEIYAALLNSLGLSE